MTDKEKAKAYDKAIMVAKNCLEKGTNPANNPLDYFINCVCEMFPDSFPELRESEDERIRKGLINFLRSPFIKETLIDEKVAPWITYLEKQKEQKPTSIVRIPKFRVGDIIQHVPLEKWDRSIRVRAIDENGYSIDYTHIGDNVSGGYIGFSFENEYELVEQKPDTRDADDLQLLGFEEMTPEEKMNHPLYLEGFDVGKEVGMVVGKQEHKWSAEDESNLKSCIGKIEIDMQHWGNHGKTMVDGDIKLIDWLKSLRERFNPQPKQEWSVDDEIIRDSIIDYINSGNIYATSKVKMITWLKCLRPQQLGIDVEKLVDWAKSNFRISSFDNTKIVTDFSNMTELSHSLREYAYTVFRPQPHWKPSEEQMEALWNTLHPDDPYYVDLSSLYDDLKKL